MDGEVWPLVAAWLAETVLAPALASAMAAAAAWVVSRLPGPLKDFLYSAVHQRDLALLNGAMERAAALAAVKVEDGLATASEATAEVENYARLNLPGTVAKLRPGAGALAVMARAAFEKARAG